MAHRLAPQALADLDNSGITSARRVATLLLPTNVIDAITERIYLLSQYPRIGRVRDDLRAGLRSFPVAQYVILYVVDDEDVEIVRVFHGRQDIDGNFG